MCIRDRLTTAQIQLLLDVSEPFKEISLRSIKKVPTLRGATVVNLFFEASTRTRLSFEFAEKRLSADAVNVASRCEGLNTLLGTEILCTSSTRDRLPAELQTLLADQGTHDVKGRAQKVTVFSA